MRDPPLMMELRINAFFLPLLVEKLENRNKPMKPPMNILIIVIITLELLSKQYNSKLDIIDFGSLYIVNCFSLQAMYSSQTYEVPFLEHMNYGDWNRNGNPLIKKQNRIQ